MAALCRETTRRKPCRRALHKARPPSCTRDSRRNAAPPQPPRRSSILPSLPSAASCVTCTTTGDVSIHRLRMSADAGYRRRRPCRSRERTNLQSEARRHPRAVLLAARRGLIGRGAPTVAPGASAPFSSLAVWRAGRQLLTPGSQAHVNYTSLLLVDGFGTLSNSADSQAENRLELKRDRSCRRSGWLGRRWRGWTLVPSDAGRAFLVGVACVCRTT